MARPTQIVFSPNGTLTEPDVHDSHLVGLFFLPTKRMLLVVKSTQNALFCLSLNEVEHFCMNELKEATTVLDITVLTGEVVSVTDIRRVAGIENAHETYTSGMLGKFKQKEFIFVEMNPSYGGSLGCICRSIEIEPDWIRLLMNAEKSS